MSLQPTFELVHVEQAEHWDAFVSLMREYADTDLNNPGLSSIHGDMRHPQERYSGLHGQAWLIQCQGQLVGCGAFTTTREAGLAELKRLYVRPSFRGLSASRPLTLHLIAQARAAGFTRMGLSTWRSNTWALGLYERMGFSPMPAFKNHPDPDLVYLGMTLTALDAVTTHTP
jgi:ribosomal protein S18 acetylase RimI-like enzyme